MIPIIDQFEYKDVWIEGLHFLLFSHDDLHEVIKQLPYRRIAANGASGWLIEDPKRQDDHSGGWYDNEYQWGDAF